MTASWACKKLSAVAAPGNIAAGFASLHDVVTIVGSSFMQFFISNAGATRGRNFDCGPRISRDREHLVSRLDSSPSYRKQSNTLKNQGYHFEHNYGHGGRNLATALVLLMMLAFLIDQIQQLSGGLFGRIWEKLGTKTKLWGMVRSLFSVLEFDSMRAVYRHLGSLYQLQLE
jgi:hypothetical protein